MAKFVILRISKLKNMKAISGSAQHTFRERDTPNADPESEWLNEITGASSSAEVIAAVKARIKAVDVVDKQAIPCIEYLITASPDQFKEGGNIRGQKAAFFKDSLCWIKDKHGAENVICSVVHEDETTPHMVAYVVPVVLSEARIRKRSVGVKGGGREVKEYVVPARSELSAKHFFGDRRKLADMQTDFADQVGTKYGLDRGVHRPIGGERVDHKTIKRFWTEMDASRREAEALRTNLEISRAKLEDDRQCLEAEKAEVARQHSLLDVVGHDLDIRQAALKERKTAVENRVKSYNANVLIFKTRKEQFGEEVQKLNEYRQNVNNLSTKLGEQQREFTEITRGYTASQINIALDYLDKARGKSR